MYCKKCGHKNDDNSKFCRSCGTPLNTDAQPNFQAQVNQSAQTPQQPTYSQPPVPDNAEQPVYSQPPVYSYNPSGAVNSVPNTHTDKKLRKMLFSSFALCILGIILPFLTWVEIPSLKSSFVQSAFEFFGGQGSISSFSIFSYGSFVSKYGRNEDIILSNIFLSIVVIAMLFYVTYIILGLLKRRCCTAFSLTGSIIMLLMSVLYTFVFVVGSSSSYIKINLTVVPWLAILFAIANIIVTIVVMVTKRKHDSRYFK